MLSDGPTVDQIRILINQPICLWGLEFDAYFKVLKKSQLILQYMCIGVQSCIQACKYIIWCFIFK